MVGAPSFRFLSIEDDHTPGESLIVQENERGYLCWRKGKKLLVEPRLEESKQGRGVYAA